MSLFSQMYNFWANAALIAHYWLGVASKEQAKRNEAIKECETFLGFWKNADFRSTEMQNAK